MCGRYSITAAPEQICAACDVELTDFVPRFNVAPTQTAPVLLVEGRTVARHLRWGMAPQWMGAAGHSTPLINARCETVVRKPSFRGLFQRQRCVVLADGFFEWQHNQKTPQPFYFKRQDHAPFGFAGLWQGKTEAVPEAFVILTTTANELVGAIHHRMPVLLRETALNTWLDPAVSVAELARLFTPFPAQEMCRRAVGIWVNDTRCDDARCVEAVTALCQERLPGL